MCTHCVQSAENSTNVSDLSSSLQQQIITAHEFLSQIQKLTDLADISNNYKCCFFLPFFVVVSYLFLSISASDCMRRPTVLYQSRDWLGRLSLTTL